MNGCWGIDLPVRFSDISDGMSHTALFAEALRGNADANVDFSGTAPANVDRSEPRRLVIAMVPMPGQLPNFDNAMAICDATDAKTAPVNFTQRGYFTAVAPGVAYYHALPPNRNSCYIPLDGYGDGVNCPSSLHGAGANVVMADGSAKFVANSIDISIWFAIGTINGSEVVSEY